MRRPSAWALITGVVGLENVKDADLVIEAVFETMAIKKEVFTALDKYAKPGAVLASNTSYLEHRRDRQGDQAVRRTCSACTSSRRPT